MTVRTATQLKPVEMFPGVVRETLGYGEKIMMARFTYAEGSKTQMHQHIHEQVIHILEGEQEVVVGDTKLKLKAGDTYVVPSNVKHSQHALTKSVTIDIWHPVRDEYKD